VSTSNHSPLEIKTFVQILMGEKIKYFGQTNWHTRAKKLTHTIDTHEQKNWHTQLTHTRFFFGQPVTVFMTFAMYKVEHPPIFLFDSRLKSEVPLHSIECFFRQMKYIRTGTVWLQGKKNPWFWVLRTLRVRTYQFFYITYGHCMPIDSRPWTLH
jgi:hypothetical protein